MEQNEITQVTNHDKKRKTKVKKLYFDDKGQVRIKKEELTAFHKSVLMGFYEEFTTKKNCSPEELKNLTNFLHDNNMIPRPYVAKLEELKTLITNLEKECSWLKNNAPDQPYSHTLENDPIDNDTEYWKHSIAHSRRRTYIRTFNKTLRSVLKDKKHISDEELKQIQTLTFKASRLGVKLREMDETIELLKMIGTGKLENENCVIKQKAAIIKRHLIDITKYYALEGKYEEHRGSVFYKVEHLTYDIQNGLFGKEIQQDGTLLSGDRSLKKIFLEFGRELHTYYDLL